jgi:hypothetical protein
MAVDRRFFCGDADRWPGGYLGAWASRISLPYAEFGPE